MFDTNETIVNKKCTNGAAENAIFGGILLESFFPALFLDLGGAII